MRCCFARPALAELAHRFLEPARLQKAFREQDPGLAQCFDLALRTLHVGQCGGLGVKILYGLPALSSAVLSLTGYGAPGAATLRAAAPGAP